MSEARSYDETTIQPPTKAIRNIYFKQTSHTNNEVHKNWIGYQFIQKKFNVFPGDEHDGRT